MFEKLPEVSAEPQVEMGLCGSQPRWAQLRMDSAVPTKLRVGLLHKCSLYFTITVITALSPGIFAFTIQDRSLFIQSQQQHFCLEDRMCD